MQAVVEKRPLRIILFLAQDQELENRPDTRRALGLLADKIRQHLKFINTNVTVLNQQTIQNEGWQVNDC